MSREDEFQPGARVRHQDGREGIIDCVAGYTVLVALDRSPSGQLEPFQMGYLEVIAPAAEGRAA